jgi:16S rRNA (uracil1498-N3)-methyltransferase
MRAALVQSHAPWLPALHPDATPAAALSALPAGGARLVLDAGGEPILRKPVTAPVTISVGPEGGLEASELRDLVECGFHPVSLGANVLRFETAAVAAIAVVRSLLALRAAPNAHPMET